MNGKTDHTQPAPSTAAVFGHPIHPMLVPFPIGALIASFIADVAFWQTADPFWARASVWLTGAGLATGVLAAAAGLVDFLTIARARVHLAGWVHFLGNVLALGLAAVSLLLRLPDAEAGVFPWGIGLSASVAALLVITGWTGGELAYRHMIGVTGHESQEEEPGHHAHH